MARKQFCGSPEHAIDRRLFLQGGLATALGVGLAGLASGRKLGRFGSPAERPAVPGCRPGPAAGAYWLSEERGGSSR